MMVHNDYCTCIVFESKLLITMKQHGYRSRLSSEVQYVIYNISLC